MEDKIDGMVREVERISREAEGNKLKVVPIHGIPYALPGLVPVAKPDPVPGPLGLSTLQGLIDYIRDKPDAAFGEGRSKAFVVIDGPTEVRYGLGAGGPQMSRAFLAQAVAEVPDIEWGAQHNIERFIVALRTLFVETDAVKTLIELLSHIDAQNSVTLSDDGLSQALTVNRGVRGKEGVKLVNPIVLQPYRTFAEVTQPASPFLIRLHGGGGGVLPGVSLTEADMGRWTLAAIQNIKTFLADALPGVAIYG